MLQFTVQFAVGKTYSTRSIGDSDCIVSVTVAKRTAKTITTDKNKVLRISLYDGVEQVRPWGRFSMCPIVAATDLEA